MSSIFNFDEKFDFFFQHIIIIKLFLSFGIFLNDYFILFLGCLITLFEKEKSHSISFELVITYLCINLFYKFKDYRFIFLNNLLIH